MTSNREYDLLGLLKMTRESENVDLPESVTGFLQDLGIVNVSSQRLDRECRISLALGAIAQGYETEAVVKQLTWKDFEGFVARVLQENDYRCTESFRRRGNKLIEGMEIDVIGVKGNTILAIDAKMWGVRAGKSSAIKEAVKKQAVRTERLGSDLARLSDKIIGMGPGRYSLIPIMVTWLVEDVEIHQGVPVVPVFKLNGFLLELARFEDFVVTFEGHLEPRLHQSRL